MKKLLLAALAVLCGAQMASGAADQVRDGESFNTPNCVRLYVRRSVDSTGTVAGRKDSAVVVCSPNVMPTPMAVGGTDDSDTTSVVFRFDTSNNLKTSEQSKDRDLDFYQTLITATALDSTAAAGASTMYSAAIDLRQYDSRSANIIIKVVWGAADTTQAATIDYAIAAHALPSQAWDWTGYGVPIAAFAHDYAAGYANVSGVTDTLGGFWQAGGITSTQTYPGEQLVRLRARPGPQTYLIRQNLNAASCMSVPLGMLLAPYQRVRFLGITLRCVARASTAVPTVRVDVEALR